VKVDSENSKTWMMSNNGRPKSIMFLKQPLKSPILTKLSQLEAYANFEESELS